MGLKCGIIGLPNVGKSTLFNCLTSSRKAEASNYPFCTIEPNVGMVVVPDRRLEKLNKIYNPPKLVNTVIEFVDIAGLVEGASKGEGLGNKFLSHIREVDAIVHIVRCFDDDDIAHVCGSIDPKRDIEIIETELILKDIETLENRMEKTAKMMKSGDKKVKEEYESYIALRKLLGSGRLAKYFTEQYRKLHSPEDVKHITGLDLLTDKHVLYVSNIDDKNLKGNDYSGVVSEIADKEGEQAIELSVEVEAELAVLEENERSEFLKELGLEETGLDRFIRAVYRLLGLITFFTAGDKEVRAWTLHKGTKAYDAAGVIHSDFQKGFIRAEVFHYDELIRLGSEHAVKEKGLMKLEGKEYEVRDGDLIYFRFNV